MRRTLRARLERLEQAPEPLAPADLAAIRVQQAALRDRLLVTVEAWEHAHPQTEAERVLDAELGIPIPPLAAWSLAERLARMLGVTMAELRARLAGPAN